MYAIKIKNNQKKRDV